MATNATRAARAPPVSERQRSIIVIGGGMAGLAAGVHARRNGYDVRIFEQHTIPGGACTSWRRRGYLIDGCIHWLIGSLPGATAHRLLDEVGALPAHGGPRLLPLTRYVLSTDEVTGRALDVTADLDRLDRDLRAAAAPQDAPLLDDALDAIRAFRGFDMPPMRARDLDTNGLRELTRTMSPSGRSVLRAINRHAGSIRHFASAARSPFLRWLWPALVHPDLPAWCVFMLLAQLVDGQLSVVEGGSLELALAVARRYAALGGAIEYRASVEEILVEGDRAVGVLLEGGREERADVIVSAVDLHATLHRLLDDRYTSPALRERFAAWRIFDPIVMTSFGVTRTFPDAPHYRHVRLDRPLSVAGHETSDLGVRVFNYDPTLAPPGRTVVQALVPAEWDTWAALRAAPDRYAAEKDRLAAAIAARLDRYLPGFTPSIDLVGKPRRIDQ